MLASAALLEAGPNQTASQPRELSSLLLLPLDGVLLQPPFYVDGALDVVSVCRLLAKHQLNCALVRDSQDGLERIGIFTTTDLRDAVLHPSAPNQLPVRAVAHFDLIALDSSANLADALLSMLRHRVHRIVVKDGARIVGLLGQLDLMRFISDHSQLIGRQIEQARSVDDLRCAAQQVEGVIDWLQRAGIRIDIVCQLVGALNNQIFARLWQLLAPTDLEHNSCLLVLGSQGRGEQIFKTDQDNALLLRDGFCCAALADVAERFVAALLSFGYPPCPGQVMLNNPLWRLSLAHCRASIARWIYEAKPDGQMKLAIFLDAHAICGDASLLTNARAHAWQLAASNESFLARMASAIDQFATPTPHWWTRLTKFSGAPGELLDLKKSAIFSIVHGARTLALEHRLDARSSTERLQALSDCQALPTALAQDLIAALHLLLAIRLRCNLQQKALGQPLSHQVDLGRLNTLERDALKDALAVVKQFKQHLRLHYRLAMV